jgi:hypothetical protein
MTVLPGWVPTNLRSPVSAARALHPLPARDGSPGLRRTARATCRCPRRDGTLPAARTPTAGPAATTARSPLRVAEEMLHRFPAHQLLPPSIGLNSCLSLGATQPLVQKVLPFWVRARPRPVLTMGIKSQTGSGLVPWMPPPHHSTPTLRSIFGERLCQSSGL